MCHRLSAHSYPIRVIVLLLATACASAHAGPREVVDASMAKLLAARSWHATMEINGPQTMTNELDFVAPDRFRIKMDGLGTQYIIGDTMVMSVQGRTMRVPMPKGTLDGYRNPGKLKAHNATMTVQSLGSELLAGKPATKYRVRNPNDGNADVLMWIGGNGYPAQITVDGKAQGQDTTTTIRYSRFNDPTIRVSAP